MRFAHPPFFDIYSADAAAVPAADPREGVHAGCRLDHGDGAGALNGLADLEYDPYPNVWGPI